MGKKRKYVIQGIFNARQTGTLLKTKGPLDMVIHTCLESFDEFDVEVKKNPQVSSLIGIIISDMKSYKKAPNGFDMNKLLKTYSDLSFRGSLKSEDPNDFAEFLVLEGDRGAMIFKLPVAAPVVLNANFEIAKTGDNDEQTEEESTND